MNDRQIIRLKPKAQALIISLWVLLSLTVVAVNIGHRVGMALRLTRYQRDSRNALALAKAGLSRVLVEIDKDESNVDSLQDPWASNDAFKNIKLNDNDAAYAFISYLDHTGASEETVYGATDEESKLNINACGKEILMQVLIVCGADTATADALAQDILYWRGDAGSPAPEEITQYYEDSLGYPLKTKPFITCGELILVKGMEEAGIDLFNKIQNVCTVHGTEAININTATTEVLRGYLVVAAGKAMPPIADEAVISGLLDKILEFRRQDKFFQEATKDALISEIGITDPQEQAVIEQLETLPIGVTSDNFNVVCTGNTGGLTRKINAIYNRADKKIIAWHEN